MELLNNWWFWFVMFIAFFITELIIGFFFNAKIHKVAEKKYKQAAIYGGIASFLLTALGAILAVVLIDSATFTTCPKDDLYCDDAGQLINAGQLIGFGIMEAFAVMFGNALAALLVPIADKKLNNYFKKRKIKKQFLKHIENKVLDHLKQRK